MPGRRPAGAIPEAARSASSLGEVLEAFLRENGLKPTSRHGDLYAAWNEIVGAEIGKHTCVSGYNKGVLEVSVDSSALINDLEFHRAALLGDVQARVKKPFVQKISFVLMPIQETHDGTEDGR